MLKTTVVAERIIQFEEILDCIEIPALEDIPGRETMVHTSGKVWQLPNTEIDITARR